MCFVLLATECNIGNFELYRFLKYGQIFHNAKSSKLYTIVLIVPTAVEMLQVMVGEKDITKLTTIPLFKVLKIVRSASPIFTDSLIYRYVTKYISIIPICVDLLRNTSVFYYSPVKNILHGNISFVFLVMNNKIEESCSHT